MGFCVHPRGRFGKLRKKIPKMNEYPLTSLVTLALVALGWVLSLRVGKARENFADALEDPEKFHSLELYSDPDFMVVFRNHQNLLEHLILVFPALWIFAWYGAGI